MRTVRSTRILRNYCQALDPRAAADYERHMIEIQWAGRASHACMLLSRIYLFMRTPVAAALKRCQNLKENERNLRAIKMDGTGNTQPACLPAILCCCCCCCCCYTYSIISVFQPREIACLFKMKTEQATNVAVFLERLFPITTNGAMFLYFT